MITKESILKNEVEQIDIEKIKNFEELLNAYGKASIQARNLGKCFDIYKRMIKDEDVTIILGLSGALIAGGLRKVIVSMIKNKIVDVIVSTGAILYQDFYQARGYKHYVGNPNANDKILNKFFIDRIYDTYVDEEKFRETDRYIATIAENLIKDNKIYSTREFLRILGNYINDENSIIYNANKNNIPIFCPAINDSSI
ncbi:MAG: deoxyhypusine synthase family protein, partial [Candidatus Altarchaeaceae archaeon]